MNWPASVISWSSVGVSAPRRRRPGCVDRSLAPMRPSRALQERSHIVVFVTSPRNLSREEGIIDNLDINFIRFPNLAISLLYRSRSWDFFMPILFFQLVILVIPWIIVYFKKEKNKFKNNTITFTFLNPPFHLYSSTRQQTLLELLKCKFEFRDLSSQTSLLFFTFNLTLNFYRILNNPSFSLHTTFNPIPL